VMYTQSSLYWTLTRRWNKDSVNIAVVYVRPPTSDAALPAPNAAVVAKALGFCTGKYADTESEFYLKFDKFTCLAVQPMRGSD